MWRDLKLEYVCERDYEDVMEWGKILVTKMLMSENENWKENLQYKKKAGE